MRSYRKLARLPVPGDPDYARRLAVALQEGQSVVARSLQELDSAPTFSAALTASQLLAVNTLTTIAFDTVSIDTMAWWNASTSTYAPQMAGIYRASWAVLFRDEAGITAAEYAYTQCGGRFAVNYSTGSKEIAVGGSVLVDCDGAATGIKVEGLIHVGSAPVALGATPYRCWLDVNYVGRKG